jgi:hypothetical protein
MWNVPSRLLTTERDENGALIWVLGDTQGDRVVFNRDGRTTIGPVRYRVVTLRNPHSPVDTEGNSQGVFAMSPSVYALASQVTRTHRARSAQASRLGT